MRMKLCWLLLGVMVGLVAVVVSPLREVLHVRGDLSNYVTPLGILGVPLVILSNITRMGRLLRIVLITTGVSAMGWPISLYMGDLLSRWFPSEPVTYILVFYVLPTTFIVGVVGATAIGIKQLFFSK